MQERRILIPVNLANNSSDALWFARKMGERLPLHVTLLNVVRLNIECGPRVYEEVCQESESALRRIGEQFFGRDHPVTVSVRMGKPSEQILAEAEAARTELLLLCRPERSALGRWFGERTVCKVIGLATCPTLVVPRIWEVMPGRPRGSTQPAEVADARWFSAATA